MGDVEEQLAREMDVEEQLAREMEEKEATKTINGVKVRYYRTGYSGWERRFVGPLVKGSHHFVSTTTRWFYYRLNWPWGKVKVTRRVTSTGYVECQRMYYNNFGNLRSITTGWTESG